MRPAAFVLLLFLPILSCAGAPPGSSGTAGAMDHDTRLAHAAQSCIAPSGDDSCDKGLRDLSAILVELAAAPGTPEPIRSAIGKAGDLGKDRPTADPAVRGALEAAWRTLAGGRDWRPPELTPGAAVTDHFGRELETARRHLREGRREEGMKTLVGVLLFAGTPYEAPM